MLNPARNGAATKIQRYMKGYRVFRKWEPVLIEKRFDMNYKYFAKMREERQNDAQRFIAACLKQYLQTKRKLRSRQRSAARGRNNRHAKHENSANASKEDKKPEEGLKKAGTLKPSALKKKDLNSTQKSAKKPEKSFASKSMMLGGGKKVSKQDATSTKKSDQGSDKDKETPNHLDENKELDSPLPVREEDSEDVSLSHQEEDDNPAELVLDKKARSMFPGVAKGLSSTYNSNDSNESPDNRRDLELRQ